MSIARIKSRADISWVTASPTHCGRASAATINIQTSTATIICTLRRCSTTAPRCGVWPVAAARRSKNGTCTDACRARYGGNHHHTRIGSGSSAKVQGQANSNMVAPDPAADEVSQSIELIAIDRSALIGRRDQKLSCTLRKFAPIIAAVEERKPRSACERDDGLAWERSKGRSSHQNTEPRRDLLRHAVHSTPYSVKLRQRIAPISVGIMAAHEPPAYQHHSGRNQHEGNAQGPGLRPQADFLRQRDIDQARKRIGRSGLCLSQGSPPFHHVDYRARCCSTASQEGGEAVGPYLRRR